MTENKRFRGLAAALVVLAVLAVLSVLGLLLGREDQNVGVAAPATPSLVQQPSATSGSPTAVPAPLTAAPAGVTWELFEGVALPTSRTDGPTRVEGPVHAGFARTPTGALLAAAQISYRTLIDPDVAGLRRVADTQLVDGPGKTAYLNLINQLRENDPPATGYAQIAGFRYVTYGPDLAVISLATRGNSGGIQVGTETMRWTDGDWKAELPASGLQQPQVVQDLSGYVPWSGLS